MVVSGQALIFVMEELDLRKKIMKIGDGCNVVLACRVSPK